MNAQNLSILKNLTALLVEDDNSLREKFKEVLELFLGEVYEAENGLVALDVYDSTKPHIIFTDVQMPFMDGIEFVEKIRAKKVTVPIVVISAHTDSSYLLKAIELHLVKYLVKPVNYTALESVLESCIENIKDNLGLEVELNSNIFYSYPRRCVISGNKEVSLTNKEYQLVELLLTHRSKPVSKKTIHEKVWSNEQMSDAALKNFILRLRKKIGIDNILTVATIGYMLPKLEKI
ncbi:MAG: response regulator transcription factor [Campylobacterota bacterium]|nr:response regulator transcription factor [Campylobacterota bacterium]